MKLPLLNPKFATIVLALAVLASGCAHLGRATVGVTNLTADVVFGVKEKPAAATPANFPSSSFTVDDVPPPSDTTPTTKKPFPFANIKPESTCPAATVRAAPKTVSGTKVTTERPTVGDYRWKRTGAITPANSKIGVSVSGFEQRQILKLTDKSTDAQNGFVDLQYTTSQIKLTEPNITVITDWRVRNLPGDAPPVASVRGNRVPSQAGMFITRIERRNTATGKKISSFEPSGTGVMYLPFPVDLGAKLNSVGVDPNTFDTFQNEATVTKKEFVDACGELIDAFRVEGTQTFTGGAGGDTMSQTYNYDIATSLGGLLVMEEIKAPLKNGSTLNTRNNIGQLQPAPLTAPAA